ncbi:MAG: DNA-binding protein, partial [Actinomycetota bacterium]|nr:DNA-binding protein [Actinomycetota bacterium]
SVVYSEEQRQAIERQWDHHNIEVPLAILRSSEELTQSVLYFVDHLDQSEDHDVVTVIIPEFGIGHWWEQLLHNRNALMLKGRLLFRKNTVVTAVPLHPDL